jgi:aspartate-semialdehyde dehydrogenase
VRVPSFVGHAEAVWLETERPISAGAAREVLETAPGVQVLDDLLTDGYPTAVDVAGSDLVVVGRMRRDPTVENGLALWVVADNVRKGAATNAVQIAEILADHWRASGRGQGAPRSAP